MELVDVIRSACGVNVIKDGITQSYESTTNEFVELMQEFVNMTKDSHEMPAFGVSLHDSTVEAMKDGLWIEFVFDRTQIHNGMPFESLLINVEKDWMGFNLIRKYNGRYEGRCYYINLGDGNMSNFVDVFDK